MIERTPSQADPRTTPVADRTEAVATAMAAGDGDAFSRLADRYRRELQAHCYRMLGSVDDSEDLVQETLLRAWRGRGTYQGRSSFRAWLYRIATNACLDAIKRRHRPLQAAQGPRFSRIPPDPEHPLEEIAAIDAEPDAEVVAKETFELAMLVAIRHLPPGQRAVLILRGVVGLSASDAASLLDSSVASVNSALQRARRTMKDRLPAQRIEWPRASHASDEERALLQRYLEAIEHADADAFVEMLCEKARSGMARELPGLRSEAGAWDGGR